MAPYVRELQLWRLPTEARNRFLQCLAGPGVPRPLWTQPLARDGRWKFLIGGGLLLLAVMALIRGLEPLEVPWIAGWALAAAPLCLGLAGWWRQQRHARRLPFPPGKYLFATELIDASEGVCRIYNLDALTGTRVANVFGSGRVGEVELQLVFGREVQSLRAPSKTAAEGVLQSLEAARSALAENMAAQVWETVGTLDPLYEARYGRGWEKMSVPALVRWSLPDASATRGKLSFPPAVLGWGLGAALLLAPALWWAGNQVRDERAFREARSAETVAAFKAYLRRGPARHTMEVYGVLLPAAALHAAVQAGSAEALREFLLDYPNSPLVGEVGTKLRGIYAVALEGTKGATEAGARTALTRLLQWQEKNRTALLRVVFAGSPEVSGARFDETISRLQRELKPERKAQDFPPLAAAFSREETQRREEAILSAIRTGLGKVVPEGVLVLERGMVSARAPADFENPALIIHWSSELADSKERPPIETPDGKVWLQLIFQFRIYLVVPGQPLFAFTSAIAPGDYLPDLAAGKSAYEAMSDIAFEELQLRIAGEFFPRHAPARVAQRSKVSRTRAPAPVAPPVRTAVATGFCISRTGYLVTSQQFAESAKEFKVVTNAGVFPADLVRQDADKDLAVLKLRQGFPAALAILPSDDLRLGETVRTISFSTAAAPGQPAQVTDGKISSLTGMENEPNYLQTSVPLTPDNSGGPVFDTQGNVLGVIAAKMVSPTALSVSYAVKGSVLLRLLEGLPELRDGLPPPAVETSKAEEMIERVRQATVLIEGYAPAR